MDKKVRAVHFNWTGNDYDIYKVGSCGVTEIKHRYAQGEGDRHYCTIYFENGEVRVIYNISQVIYEPVNTD